jgi:preprotein translocase subunit SecY
VSIIIFGGIIARLPGQILRFYVFLCAGDFPTAGALFWGIVAMLIVVGVALDTMRQLEAQLVMRNYRGFISTGSIQTASPAQV